MGSPNSAAQLSPEAGPRLRSSPSFHTRPECLLHVRQALAQSWEPTGSHGHAPLPFSVPGREALKLDKQTADTCKFPLWRALPRSSRKS